MKKSKLSTPSIALVYDKLNTPYGGAEWVLLALQQAFPNAPLYTSLSAPKKTPWAQNFRVFTSFLQYIPIKNHTFLVWLFPLAFESLDLSAYDAVISVTSGEAKGILTKPNQLHVSYILTPPRYLYTHIATYLDSKPLLKLPGISYCTQRALSYLRWWDQAAASRPDKVIAISKKIKARIQSTYGREADLVYPPLPNIPSDTQPLRAPTEYVLTLSRLVAYKRVDLAIKAALKSQNNLVVAGRGEEEKTLIRLAGAQAQVRKNEPLAQWIKNQLSQPTTLGKILFVGQVSNTERLELLAGTKALIMPGVEDFGITALEAAAVGTPSILHAQSGVSEILHHKKHALHIQKESTEEIMAAIATLFNQVFDFRTLQTQAETCSTRVFTSKFQKYMYDNIILLKSKKT